MFNKNNIFSLLLITISIIVINSIIPVSVDKNFLLVVSKNKEHIQNISQPRKIKYRKKYYIDELSLADSDRFRHSKLGDLGYQDNYFSDTTGKFNVTKSGSFRILVESDDGFIFHIDNELICKFDGARPLAATNCGANLTAGKHEFSLSHYQGFGLSGLRVRYVLVGTNDFYIWGQDSDYIQFGR